MRFIYLYVNLHCELKDNVNAFNLFFEEYMTMMNVNKMMLACPAVLKLALRPVLAVVVATIALMAFPLPSAHASTGDRLEVKVYGVDRDGNITVFESLNSPATFIPNDMAVTTSSLFEKPGNIFIFSSRKNTPYARQVQCSQKTDANVADGVTEPKCEVTIDNISTGLDLSYQIRKADSSFIKTDDLVLDVKASLSELSNKPAGVPGDINSIAPEVMSGTANFIVDLKKGQVYKREFKMGMALPSDDTANKVVYIEVKII